MTAHKTVKSCLANKLWNYEKIKKMEYLNFILILIKKVSENGQFISISWSFLIFFRLKFSDNSSLLLHVIIFYHCLQNVVIGYFIWAEHRKKVVVSLNFAIVSSIGEDSLWSSHSSNLSCEWYILVF